MGQKQSACPGLLQASRVDDKEQFERWRPSGSSSWP